MLRYVLLAVMCSVGIKDCDDQTGIVVQMLNLRNSTEYLLQNPNVKLLELEQTERNLGVQKRYTMGARVSGDKLVASADGGQTFPSPQDLKLTIDYPPKGIGGSAILSYVEIRVEQSSNLGKAYIISGGIGQGQISIGVDILETTYFKAVVNFYGY